LFSYLQDQPSYPQSSSGEVLCEVFSKPNPFTMRPISTNLGILIDYMSYKTNVEPSLIQKFAIHLDEELQKRFVNRNMETKIMNLQEVYHWLVDPTTMTPRRKPKRTKTSNEDTIDLTNEAGDELEDSESIAV